MKKIYLVICILSLCTMSSMAQTKIISHKSHSGSNNNFKKALANNSSNLSHSNFGMYIEPTIRTAQLDTLQFMSDSLSVMITSNYCQERRSENTELWESGKAILENHPLFSQQHSLDSIKLILSSQYNFQNSIDNVVFIGYDNGEDILEDCGTPISESCQEEDINEELESELVNVLIHEIYNESSIDENDIKIMPNPTSDYFQLSESVSELLVFDLKGKLCLRKVNNVNRVNVSLLATGTYLVIFKDNQGKRHSEKVVKI